MFRIASFVAALLALVLYPISAFAADTVVDFSGLIEPVVTSVFAVISTVAIWFLRKGVKVVEEKTDMQLDAQLASRLDGALYKALEFGRVRATELAKTRAIKVDFRHEMLAYAARYARDSVPAALEYFDVDQTRLIFMLEARLGVDLDGDGNIGGGPKQGVQIGNPGALNPGNAE